jgi:hypothetical protein
MHTDRHGRNGETSEDLAQIEAIENAKDLAEAQAALADGEHPVLWEEAKVRLDSLHGFD